jgi:hypothetical protein
MKAAPAWTAHEIETLKRLWDEGLSGGQIAREMGRTRGAVMGKAGRLGLFNDRQYVKPPLALAGSGGAPRVCQWPTWPHGAKPTQEFCGRPAKADSSYCPEHHVRSRRSNSDPDPGPYAVGKAVAA